MRTGREQIHDEHMEIFINGEKLKDVIGFKLDFVPPEAGKKYFHYNYTVDYALTSPYGFQEKCEMKSLYDEKNMETDD